MGNILNRKIKFTMRVIALLAITLCAISAVHPSKMLRQMTLGSFPADISVCADVPESVLQAFQATFDAQPAKGSTISVHLDGTATTDLNITTIQVATTFGGNVVQTDKFKYGKDIKAGENMHWDYQQYLPGFTPSGAYTLRVEFLDASGKSNACAAVNLTL